MTKENIVVRLQYFRDFLSEKITENENSLMMGKDRNEEKKCMIISDIYDNILHKFENIFKEEIYKE